VFVRAISSIFPQPNSESKENIMTIPKEVTPYLIGEVVTFQVFERETLNSDTLESDSLKKYVGRLQTYYHDKYEFVFQLVGGAPVVVSHKNQYVEAHPCQAKEPTYVFG
jgi:hypothetical protein